MSAAPERQRRPALGWRGSLSSVFVVAFVLLASSPAAAVWAAEDRERRTPTPAELAALQNVRDLVSYQTDERNLPASPALLEGITFLDAGVEVDLRSHLQEVDDVMLRDALRALQTPAERPADESLFSDLEWMYIQRQVVEERDDPEVVMERINKRVRASFLKRVRDLVVEQQRKLTELSDRVASGKADFADLDQELAEQLQELRDVLREAPGWKKPPEPEGPGEGPSPEPGGSSAAESRLPPRLNLGGTGTLPAGEDVPRALRPNPAGGCASTPFVSRSSVSCGPVAGASGTSGPWCEVGPLRPGLVPGFELGEGLGGNVSRSSVSRCDLSSGRSVSSVLGRYVPGLAPLGEVGQKCVAPPVWLVPALGGPSVSAAPCETGRGLINGSALSPVSGSISASMPAVPSAVPMPDGGGGSAPDAGAPDRPGSGDGDDRPGEDTERAEQIAQREAGQDAERAAEEEVRRVEADRVAADLQAVIDAARAEHEAAVESGDRAQHERDNPPLAPPPVPATPSAESGSAPVRAPEDEDSEPGEDAEPADDSGGHDEVYLPEAEPEPNPAAQGSSRGEPVEVVDGGAPPQLVSDAPEPEPAAVLPDCAPDTSYMSHCGGTGENTDYAGLDVAGVPRPNADLDV